MFRSLRSLLFRVCGVFRSLLFQVYGVFHSLRSLLFQVYGVFRSLHSLDAGGECKPRVARSARFSVGRKLGCGGRVQAVRRSLLLSKSVGMAVESASRASLAPLASFSVCSCKKSPSKHHPATSNRSDAMRRFNEGKRYGDQSRSINRTRFCCSLRSANPASHSRLAQTRLRSHPLLPASASSRNTHPLRCLSA